MGQRMEGKGRQCSSRNWCDILRLYSTKRKAEGGVGGPIMKIFCLSFFSVEGLILHPFDLLCRLVPITFLSGVRHLPQRRGHS